MGARGSSRDKILHCAREMFYQAGYQATSVDDILRRCGVAKSNFYYHFASKEQLAMEVMELWMAEQEALVLYLLHDADRTPAQRLHGFFDQVCRVQAEIQDRGGCPFGNFAASLPSAEHNAGYERFRRRLSESFLQMEAAVCDCLADGSARGEFRDDMPPTELASFLVATLQGLLLLTKTHQDITPLVNGLSVLERLLRT